MKTDDTQRRKKRSFKYRIARERKITGAEAILAAELGLGQVYRSANGEFALKPNDRRTPSHAA
jgi:hypothetical protein